MNFSLFLSTPYPIADLIDFSCAYLFIKLIYYALGKQVIGPGGVPGAGRAEMSITRPCSCSQPSGGGQGITKQLQYVRRGVCTDL